MDTGQKMKKIVRFIAFFVFSTLLVSQSIVDVAKKEQERREKLKGKNAKVVTNADLKAVKRAPAVTIPPAPPAEAAAAEPEEAELPDAQQAERAYDEGAGSPFATEVLPDILLVENPEYALYNPDGQFAEISFGGFLDLDLLARDGPGDDIAIYARRSGTRDGEPIEEGIPAGLEGRAFPSQISYGVLVLSDVGVWIALGSGQGVSSPENFDLGGIPIVHKIRIIFRPLANTTADIKHLQLTPNELTMGIDAVEALH